MEDAKETQDKKIAEAFIHIQAHSLLNLYVCECLAFKKIKPNEKIPFERYFHELDMDRLFPFINPKFLDGDFIVNGCAADKSFDELCFYLYREKTDIIFELAPVDKSFDDENDIHHYKHGLYEYLIDAYPLFKKIILTEISPDPFASSPDIVDWKTLNVCYSMAAKFISAIRLKKIRQGGKIDRYIKDMPYLSPALNRLITVRKGHYYLKNGDTLSRDYKLALFSCFKFFNPENAKLFELKASSLDG